MAWNDEPQPTLATTRLILRPFRLSDADLVQQLAGDRAIADMLPLLPHPYEDGVAETWIATHADAFHSGAAITLAITTPPHDSIAGSITLGMRMFNAAELGYWLGRPYWGRGLMTEAGQAMLLHGFGTVGLNRIFALHFTRNPASGRVMEKLGMQFEGVQREAGERWGLDEDFAVRAILRSDWEARRR